MAPSATTQAFAKPAVALCLLLAAGGINGIMRVLERIPTERVTANPIGPAFT